MIFDYYYEGQTAEYPFMKLPKQLFRDKILQELTADAKLLYVLMLDRVSLSEKKDWVDGKKRIYIVFTIRNIKKALNCANSKACDVLKELENVGLVEKKKQGFGKPTLIYVKDCTRFRNPEHENSENHNSMIPENGIYDFRKSECNNTKNNKTENIYTYPILSGTDVDEIDRSEMQKNITERLDMQILYEEYPYDRGILDEILDLITDVLCSKRKNICIAGDEKPVQVVKSQFMKLNMMHIEYVMDCMNKNSVKVRNIKQYLLATIYNAPLTMQSYYQARVNNDMAGENQED